MQSLKNLGENFSWGDDCSFDSDYYLEAQKQVMIHVINRGGKHYFYNDQEEKLRAMKERGVELAGYALNNYKKSDWEIAQHAVEQIKKKLSSKKEK